MLSSETVIFLLAYIGLTAIIASSKLFEPIRNLLAFSEYLYGAIGCYQCVGFWAGFIFALIHGESLLSSFSLGCVVSLLSFAFSKIIYLIDHIE